MRERVKSTALSLLATVLLHTPSWALADTTLPAPQTSGGEGIFTALKARRSDTQNNFPTNALSKQELSTLLWAASGLNREGKGWTAPYGLGSAPYVRVYVADADGVSLYDWKTHALKAISNEDIRHLVGRQNVVKNAPTVLILVADKRMLSRAGDEHGQMAWAYLASGAMTQNVYLAAASMNVGARFVITMDTNAVTEKLGLSKEDVPLNLMLLGKR